jgi:membrane protein
MVWVNVNVYLLLFGNELNLAIRRVRLDKLIADELQKEIPKQVLNPESEQVNDEHQIILPNNSAENSSKP